MAFEFPFNFTPKTTAKAAQVMANFNAVKTLLTGGLTLENFAAGAMPGGTTFSNVGGPLVLTVGGVDMLPSGGAGEAFNLPVKSKVLFIVDVDLELVTLAEEEGIGARATLYLDNVAQGVYTQIGSQKLKFFGRIRQSLSDSSWVTMAAGNHQLRLIGSSANASGAGQMYACKVSYIAVPTT